MGPLQQSLHPWLKPLVTPLNICRIIDFTLNFFVVRHVTHMILLVETVIEHISRDIRHNIAYKSMTKNK